MIKFESCWALRRTKTHLGSTWKYLQRRQRERVSEELAILSKKIGSVIEAAGANSMSPESTLENPRELRKLFRHDSVA